MQTPATTALDRAGVDHRTTEYDLGQHDRDFGQVLVDALELDPDTVGKTLIVTLDDDRHVIAVVPVSAMLDLKALARAAGAKRATMTDPATAERLSGSVVGGIAPLGHRHPLPVFLDELFTVSEEIHVSGGRRGLEITLRPEDLVAATRATVADLSTRRSTGPDDMRADAYRRVDGAETRRET